MPWTSTRTFLRALAAACLLARSLADSVTVCTPNNYMGYAAQSTLLDFEGTRIHFAYLQGHDLTSAIGAEECDILELSSESVVLALARGAELTVQGVRTQFRERMQVVTRQGISSARHLVHRTVGLATETHAHVNILHLCALLAVPCRQVGFEDYVAGNDNSTASKNAVTIVTSLHMAEVMGLFELGRLDAVYCNVMSVEPEGELALPYHLTSVSSLHDWGMPSNQLIVTSRAWTDPSSNATFNHTANTRLLQYYMAAVWKLDHHYAERLFSGDSPEAEFASAVEQKLFPEHQSGRRLASRDDAGVAAEELARSLPDWYRWPRGVRFWESRAEMMTDGSVLTHLAAVAEVMMLHDKITAAVSPAMIRAALQTDPSVTESVEMMVNLVTDRFNWTLGASPGEARLPLWMPGAKDEASAQAHCSGEATLEGSSGSLSDQAGLRREYAEDAICKWRVLSQPGGASSNSASPILLVPDFLRLEALGGEDAVSVFEGEPPYRLLARFAGERAAPVRALGGMVVVFASGKRIRHSPDERPTGFFASFSRSICATDLNGCGEGGTCQPDGTCRCEEGRGGANCSLLTCLGTTVYELAKSQVEVLRSNSYREYGAMADCRWEVRPPADCPMCAVEVTFDSFVTELGRDFVQLLTSAADEPFQWGAQQEVLHLSPVDWLNISGAVTTSQVLSGELNEAGFRFRSNPAEAVHMRFTSDAVRHLPGFEARIRVVDLSAGGEEVRASTSACYTEDGPEDEVWCNGRGACIAGVASQEFGTCQCDSGWFGAQCQLPVCLNHNAAMLGSKLDIGTGGRSTLVMRGAECEWELRPDSLLATTDDAITPLPVHSLRLLLSKVHFRSTDRLMVHRADGELVLDVAAREQSSYLERAVVSPEQKVMYSSGSSELSLAQTCEARGSIDGQDETLSCELPSHLVLRVSSGPNSKNMSFQMHVLAVYDVGQGCLAVAQSNSEELACECQDEDLNFARFDSALLRCIPVDSTIPASVFSNKEGDSWPPYMLGTVCGMAALLLMLVVIGIVQCRKGRAVHVLSPAVPTQDLETPVAKVMTFLRELGSMRYGFLSRSQIHHAIDLHQMLMDVDNPTVPQLNATLLNDAYNNDIAQFLMASTAAKSAYDADLSLHQLEDCRSLYDDIEQSVRGPRVTEATSLKSINSQGSVTAKSSKFEGLAEVGTSFFVDFTCVPKKTTLVRTAMHIFTEWNMLRPLKIRKSKMVNFLECIEDGYLDNPYHGAVHAADVTSRLSAILQHSGIRQHLEQTHSGILQLFGVILSAVIHDYAHPGVTNAFAVTMKYPEARIHNDQAVFENNSLYLAWQIADRPECNFMENMHDENRRVLRTMVINMVLATDMSKHFDIISTVKFKLRDFIQPERRNSRGSTMRNTGRLPLSNSMMDSWQPGRRTSIGQEQPSPKSKISDRGMRESSTTVDLSRFHKDIPFRDLGVLTQEQMLLLLQLALKVADLGHCTLPKDQHLFWVRALEQEFFHQGDLERARGIPISPLMDRSRAGPCDGVNQSGFFDVIIIPLCDLWDSVLPGGCSQLCQQARENVDMWRALSVSEERSSLIVSDAA